MFLTTKIQIRNRMPFPFLLLWSREKIPRRYLQGLSSWHYGRLSKRATLWIGKVLGLFAIFGPRWSRSWHGATPNSNQVQNCRWLQSITTGKMIAAVTLLYSYYIAIIRWVLTLSRARGTFLGTLARCFRISALFYTVFFCLAAIKVLIGFLGDKKWNAERK